MEINYKNPQIIVIAGKARSGKNTIGEIFKNLYEQDNKKVVISPYTKYLKDYIKEITGNYVDDDNKPRELLQQLGVEIIKEKLKKYDMFIERQLDDIDIYSYFFDSIIIPDARFPKEIDILKEKYPNVISIKVVSDLENNMTEREKQHVTETSLDGYDDNKFDYIINNLSIEESTKLVEEIYEEIKK